jgi:hypothetical protein
MFNKSLRWCDPDTLEFDSSVRFIGPYFMSKRRGKALISLDKPEQFLKQLSLKGVEIA